MRNPIKRIFSLLLAFILTIGMAPALTVSAASTMSLISGVVTNRAANSAELEVKYVSGEYTSDTQCTFWYLVLPKDDPQPQDPTNASDLTGWVDISFFINDSNLFYIGVQNLTEAGVYKIYIVAQVEDETDLTSMLTADIPALDATPLELIFGNISRVSDANATVEFTSNKAGTYYYLIQETNGTAPTTADEFHDIITDPAGYSMNVGTNTASITTLTAGAKKITVMGYDGYNYTLITTTINTYSAFPSAPQNLTTTQGDRKVTLNWEAPADSGSSVISKYQYSASTSIDNWQDIPDSNAGTASYTVTGLTNGTEYTFKVRAVNAAGAGAEATATATPNIPAKPVVSSISPADYSVGVAVSGEIIIVFDMDMDKQLTGMVGFRTPSGYTTLDGTWSTTGNKYIIPYSNLKYNSTYTIEVSGFKSASGESMAGSFSSDFTTKDIAPSAPQNLTASPGGGKVTLSWTAPADNGGSAIIKYQYVILMISGPGWQDIPDSDSGTTSHTVTGLTNDIGHTFRVRAVNAAGEGATASVTATPKSSDNIVLENNNHLYIYNDGYVILTEPNKDDPKNEGTFISYSGSYTLSGGTSTNALTNATITVMNGYDGGTAGTGKTITLNGLDIYVREKKDFCAFALKGNAKVNLVLAGANRLTSGLGRAGLEVPTMAVISIDKSIDNAGGTLRAAGFSGGAGIGGGNGGNGGAITITDGTVDAIGSVYGAGIGGGNGGSGGTVTISGGTVNPYSDTYGAGIGGGGFGGNGGTVTISGGTITATGNGGGAGIGGGFGGGAGTTVITGGSVKADGKGVDGIQGTPTNAEGKQLTCVVITVGGNPLTAITIDSIPMQIRAKYDFTNFSFNGIKPIGGVIYLWLPQIDAVTGGSRTITLLDGQHLYIFANGYVFAGVNETPTASVKGFISHSGSYTLSGGGNGTTVTVMENVTKAITLNGLNINNSVYSNYCAFGLLSGANITLTLAGSNTLTSGENRAGLEVPVGTCVSISSAGTLTATSSNNGAGIGGGYGVSGGTVNISGGTITATGGSNGAGIGGGYYGSAGTTVITGGSVKASGRGVDGIQGMPTNTAGQSLTCVTVTVPTSGNPLTAITINSIPQSIRDEYNFTSFSFTGIQSIDGKIYLWLPRIGTGQTTVINNGDGDNSSGNGVITVPATTNGSVTVNGYDVKYTVTSGAFTAIITGTNLKDIVNETKSINGIKIVVLDFTGIDNKANISSFNLSLDLSGFTGNETITFIIKTPLGDIIYTLKELKAMAASSNNVTLNLQKGSLIVGANSGGKNIAWNKLSPMTRVGVPYTLKPGENAALLVVTDKNGRVLPTSVYENGKVYADIIATGKYEVKLVEAPAFADINSQKMKTDIVFVVIRGLISGTTETTYSPETPITRAEYVTALAKASGANVSGYIDSSFADVAKTNLAMHYIEWAARNKIVQGYDGKFSPDNAISREEMAVMMVNYAKALGYALPDNGDKTAYADAAEISAWAKDAVEAMRKAGVITGKDGNIFDPKGSVTRSEAASILRRFVEFVISSRSAEGWSNDNTDTTKLVYINQNGNRLTGWQAINGERYYFEKDGIMRTGWQTISGKKYYFGLDGKLRTGWQNIDNKRYWFDNNGIMVSGQWVEINGKWYYFNADGTLAVNTTIDGYKIGEDGVRIE